MTEMELDIDNQMYAGDGTGTNFNGLVSDATTFVAPTALALAVTLPNFGDVLKAASLQARLNHFNPDVAVVNPSDFALLELEKDTAGNYVLPPFKTADGTLVAGMRIVQNTNVTINTALVFDSALPKFYVAREMQMQVWDQNENDALLDRKTVTLWFRGQMRVRTNEKLGLIKITDIDAAITALTKA
jgi:HK97 family phage major capsid protein